MGEGEQAAVGVLESAGNPLAVQVVADGWGLLPPALIAADTARSTSSTAKFTSQRDDMQPTAPDPRLMLLLHEAFRHGKAIGTWADADAILADAAIPSGAPGVVQGNTATNTFEQVTQLLGAHRVWERFPTAV